MKSVEDMDVFKLAHQLAFKTYSTTKVFPKEETFSLIMSVAAPRFPQFLLSLSVEERVEAQSSKFLAVSRHHKRFGWGSLL